MPCNSILMSSVEFSMEKTDYELFKKGMTNLGYTSPIVDSQGVLTFYRGKDKVVVNGNKLTVDYRGDTGMITEIEVINSIKRAYSNQVVVATSAKFGWKIKTNGQNKFEVQR